MRSAGVQPVTRHLLDGVYLLIRTIRVVVVQYEMPDVRSGCQGTDLGYQAMPPAVFVWHITVEILGVMDEYVRALAKIDKFLKFCGLRIRWL
jgi:hypothetical protein